MIPIEDIKKHNKMDLNYVDKLKKKFFTIK